MTDAIHHIIRHSFTRSGIDARVAVGSVYPDHFHCFCYKVFYFSTFKDFNTVAPAC